MKKRIILEVKNLSKSFGGLQAVCNLNFAITKGLITALIGPNGSGKTTTFNMISGHIPPTQGEIYFYGKKINGLSAHRISRLGIARTFQNLEIFGHLTVLENILLAIYRHEKIYLWETAFRFPSFFHKEKKALKEAEKYLKLLSLENFAHIKASNLPFGIQRYLEIARALATRPKFLLLDEAASGLDASEKEFLVKIIEKIKAEGITILMVEHDMNLTMELAEEIIVLDQGKKIAQGSPQKIQKDPRVIAVYLGEDNAAN